jgi:hypothetical protein
VRRTKFGREEEMRRAIFAVISVALASLGVASIGVVGASAGGLEEFPRICHRTGASDNPYVNNQPNNQGQFEGHADHTGPIWQPGAQQWGDIIPPIPSLNFPGLNWPEGEATHANDCVPPNLPPPTPPNGQEGAAPAPGPGAAPAAAALTGVPSFTG